MRARFCLVAAAIAAGGFVSGSVLFSASARAELLIEIDKTAQRMSVTRDGERLYVWPVSTGRSGHDTPSGRYTPFRLEKDHFSREWDDAPMPNSVFFTKQGHAIHGSFEVKKLGSAASAGCVRLAPQNAETLFNMVKAEGLNNVKVAIGGQATPRRAPMDEIARGAPQNINPYPDQQAPGQQYIYRDRDSRYPDPYAGQPRYDPRYGYSQQPSQQPRYYYDEYGRLRYVQPQYQQPYQQPPVYYQRRGYGYGWN